jgi:hypothetical protein
MNTLVRILVSLGWGSGALVVSFLIGCVAGAVAWWKLFPRWPIEYSELAKLIGSLNVELRKMDHAVDTLWLVARFREERVPSASAITTLGSDPNLARINKLVVDVITVKRRLESLLRDLEKVSPWLTAGQTPRQPQKRLPVVNAQGVVIDRKKEEQRPTSDILGSNDDPPDAELPILPSAGDQVLVAVEKNDAPQTKPHGAHDSSQMIELYNRALADPLASREFREQYQPIRIDIVNAVERRLSPTARIDPEFKQTPDGDFFALPLSEPNKYSVVPRLGLTIGPVSYQAGALGEMFGRPDYDPAQSYSRYQVRKPALFRRDGDNWELVQPGQIELGAPD